MPSPATTTLAYPDWKAPREDGQTLVWPEPAVLLERTLDNRRLLAGAAGVTVQNVPLPELRRRQRAWIGHTHDEPIIGDGHQSELHHPGVWAKRVLSHAAAARLGGQALHVAVDTDAPKHLLLRWPGGSAPITDDPDLAEAPWAALLDAPTPAHVTAIERSLGEAGLAEKPQAHEFLASLRRLALEQPKLPAALTQAMHELDWSLGLRHHAILASPLWASPPFLVFAHHFIARAGEFAGHYNTALADYRRDKKVRTPTRPMPDLAVSAEAVELPFWLDDLASGTRGRAKASARGGRFVLPAPNGGAFEFDVNLDGWDAAERLERWLREHRLRLSPRALTLTMFLRLLVVDQFVHGIGGGQYDQVTDRIIASHFAMAPPTFAVATATMYLPEAVGRSRVCVACIEQEGHRLKHSLLGPRKGELLHSINAAPRRSRERYNTFVAMHRELASAAKSHPALAAWQDNLDSARAREAEELTLFDRELLYALQPGRRLEAMAAALTSIF